MPCVHVKHKVLPLSMALAMSVSLSSHVNSMTPDSDLMALVTDGDLTNLSLESLMNINVYSVSKSAEPWLRSAAAIYVLSGDEIKRSGVKTMPEALRLVPGVTVARLDAHSWAVTTRGFNGTLVDKLEVLVDGRSLYTPLFSGVYWQKHNIPMSNIERIEVIRGPGASLWGANAVNGVINIVTRSAMQADSFRAETGVSNGYSSHSEFSSALKGDGAALQVYGREERFADFRLRNGSSAEDGFESRRIGFRSDFSPGTRGSSLMVQGEHYSDRIHRPAMNRDETNETDFILANWIGKQPDGSSLEVRAYVDQSNYTIPGLFSEDRRTFELEIIRHFYLGDAHEIVVGAAYNQTSDEIESPDQNVLGFVPAKRKDSTYDVYIQDQIGLIKDKLRLTAGLKAESNEYSGTELQPTVRLAYTPSANTTVWGGVSRAVRIPTRLDEDFLIFAPKPAPPGTAFIKGSKSFDAETLVALEMGFRQQYSNDVSLDVAVYRNEYRKLRGLNANVFPAEISNEGEGDTSGIEMTVQWKFPEHWIHRASYTYQHVDFHAKRGSSDTSIKGANRNDPRHQGMLHSTWQANDAFSVDTRLRNVSELPDRKVDGYSELDLSVSWQINPNFRVSMLGQNLLDKAHSEFSASDSGVEVHRSIHFGLEWVY